MAVTRDTRELARAGRGSSSGTWQQVLKSRWCYLFMVPSLVLAGMFTFYPMVMSWYFSFLNWTGFTADKTFVGLDNYRELVDDPLFWDAFGRSFLFVLVAVPVRLVLSLLVAILLNNQMLRLAPVFRTFFFLPVITTAAIVGIVMTFVLSPFQGPMNQALTGLGIVPAPVDFLGNPDTALWSVMAVEVWKNFGITMIYWLAALQTVPKIYYEAAKVDGASRFQLVRYITVPVLLPFAAIITLLTANATLHVFAIVQAMTKGGPYFSTQVIEVYIYQTAFAADQAGGVPRLGYASAAGCLFGVVVMLIAILQVYVARRAAQARSQLVGGG
ncbi:sugar ABC transporter permease [Actinopolymorpha sp. B11F2]|uniref:carbohydrate ABC transporter permease n=1 Tax=Actinopolymorpha sp. B11F2 TaxID=3160862 RepID=UPI0032E4DC41